MADDLKSVLKTLDHLIEVCTQSEEGLAAAASAVQDDSIRQELLRYSRERADFAATLGDVMRDTLGTEPKNPAVTGALRTGWADLPKRGPDAEVLSACQSGDHETVAAYRDALGEPPPVEALLKLISSQYEAVSAAHNRIRELHDAAASG